MESEVKGREGVKEGVDRDVAWMEREERESLNMDTER